VTAAPLPLLPPAFGVDDNDVRPGGRNMLDLLAEDHHQLVQLCARLASSAFSGPSASSAPSVSAAPSAFSAPSGFSVSEARRVVSEARRVEDVLVATLSRHLSAEEQYLYPTVRKVLPDGGTVADHEVARDAEMLEALRELHLTGRDDIAYRTLVDTVASHVRQHAERTSNEVFPRLQAECSDNELIRLGNRVLIAQESAPTRPHPSTPLTPPLNKIVDPAVGVVDKVRDVLSRRTTWPQDI
jgi:hypothetical protein